MLGKIFIHLIYMKGFLYYFICCRHTYAETGAGSFVPQVEQVMTFNIRYTSDGVKLIS